VWAFGQAEVYDLDLVTAVDDQVRRFDINVDRPVFVSVMKDYFAETDNTKRDAIAAYQLSAPSQHQSSREKPLRLSDVKAMFLEFRRIVGRR
jgi:hypothetical protein